MAVGHAPEHAPNFSLDRQITRARKEMGEERWAELDAEWDRDTLAIERAVK